MLPAGYVVYQGHMNLWWAATASRTRPQRRLGRGLLDRRQRRPAAGGALRQMGPDEPPRPRPDDVFFRQVRFGHRSAWASAPRCAHLHRVSRRNRTDAATALSHLYFRYSWPWCLGLAYAGMAGEAGTIRIRRFTRCSIAFIPSSLRFPCSSARCGSSGPT